jgi:hypothetical protein
VVATRAGGDVKLAAVAVALVACGSSTNHGTPVVDAYQGSGCATLTGGISDFEPGVDNTPVGFPSPPNGLILCGTDPMTNNPGASPETWFLAGSLSGSDVFGYYETQLMTKGYTVTGPTVEAGSNEKLVFAMGSDSGSVVFNSAELFVLLLFSS